MSNTTTNKKPSTTVKKEAPVTQDALEKKMADLLALEKQLQDKIAQLDQVQSTPSVQPSQTADHESNDFDIINPNKKIRVYSMTFGLLSLYCAQRGFTDFKDYGGFKILTYAQLGDYMLTCSETFKAGYLYIADEKAVESFGLAEIYSDLFSMSLVDEIIKGTAKDYESQIASSTVEQKKALADYIALKVFTQDFTDLNAVSAISRACDIDIMGKVSQMREMAQYMTGEE